MVGPIPSALAGTNNEHDLLVPGTHKEVNNFDSLAASPHFILLSALGIWVADALGGGPAVGGISESSLLGHSNSTLSSLA